MEIINDVQKGQEVLIGDPDTTEVDLLDGINVLVRGELQEMDVHNPTRRTLFIREEEDGLNKFREAICQDDVCETLKGNGQLFLVSEDGTSLSKVVFSTGPATS